MSFHLFLPQMRMPVETIVERARAAEAAGFEGLALMDHLALCDALRHPAVLARQATSLDHASGGRFELGIGWGSVPEELTTFGIGTAGAAERAARLGETLTILRRLWSGEVVDHHGEHVTLTGAQQRPVPIRPIPVTVGG